MDNSSQLRLFLEPRSIALVGLPRDTGPGSRNIMEMLRQQGYQGTLYPVNPKCGEVLGVTAYPCVRDLPEVPDLAVILTPRHLVAPLVKECGEKGIKALVVVAQGFADVPGEGNRLQEELVSTARRYGSRILGPNTFGVANAFLGVNTAFALTQMQKVPVGMICQSGFPFAGFPRLVVVGKALDIGNTSDIDFSDGLNYFAGDDQIRVVLLYMEGIKDGRRFLDAARRATARKPVIALKAGRGASGARVAGSHSGSLTGADQVYEAAFRQSGIIRVSDTEEFADLCRAFLVFPPSRGRRLGVMSMTMGGGTLVADACEKYNMKLVTFSGDTTRKITAMAPSWLKISNPLDAGAVSFGPAGSRESFRSSLEAILGDPVVDCVLVVVPDLEAEQVNFQEAALEMAEMHRDKAIAFWVYGPDFDGRVAAKFESTGRILNFLSPDRAIRALARMAEYRERVSNAICD
ncbi:MAG: CoA-binding protein [Chloroflexi bacterium]|nr:CoA-binding protein [Chloroflexota bacterium]